MDIQCQWILPYGGNIIGTPVCTSDCNWLKEHQSTPLYKENTSLQYHLSIKVHLSTSTTPPPYSSLPYKVHHCIEYFPMKDTSISRRTCARAYPSELVWVVNGKVGPVNEHLVLSKCAGWSSQELEEVEAVAEVVEDGRCWSGRGGEGRGGKSMEDGLNAWKGEPSDFVACSTHYCTVSCTLQN